MTEEQQKLLKYAEKAEIDKLLPFFEVLEEIRDILGNKEMPKVDIPEHPEVQKVSLEGIEVITIKGDRGDSPTDEHLTNLIKPLIPEVKDGYTPIKGKDYFDGKDGYTPLKDIDYRDGEDGISPSVEDIAQATSEKLTPLLPKKEEIVEEVLKSDKLKELDKSDVIQKITDSIKEIQERFTSISSSGGFGSRRVYVPMRDNFTSLTDGATRIFYLSKAPLKSDTIQVFGTDFPIILDPATDFTVVGKTLTLSSSFPAPSAGSTLIIYYHA